MPITIQAKPAYQERREVLRCSRCGHEEERPGGSFYAGRVTDTSTGGLVCRPCASAVLVEDMRTAGRGTVALTETDRPCTPLGAELPGAVRVTRRAMRGGWTRLDLWWTDEEGAVWWGWTGEGCAWWPWGNVRAASIRLRRVAR